jgi:hypothetical protein
MAEGGGEPRALRTLRAARRYPVAGSGGHPACRIAWLPARRSEFSYNPKTTKYFFCAAGKPVRFYPGGETPALHVRRDARRYDVAQPSQGVWTAAASAALFVYSGKLILFFADHFNQLNSR